MNMSIGGTGKGYIRSIKDFGMGLSIVCVSVAAIGGVTWLAYIGTAIRSKEKLYNQAKQLADYNHDGITTNEEFTRAYIESGLTIDKNRLTASELEKMVNYLKIKRKAWENF